MVRTVVIKELKGEAFVRNIFPKVRAFTSRMFFPKHFPKTKLSLLNDKNLFAPQKSLKNKKGMH